MEGGLVGTMFCWKKDKTQADRKDSQNSMKLKKQHVSTFRVFFFFVLSTTPFQNPANHIAIQLLEIRLLIALVPLTYRRMYLQLHSKNILGQFFVRRLFVSSLHTRSQPEVTKMRQ